MPLLARLLILAGIVLVAAGLLVALAGRLSWAGRLPGDLLIQRGRVTLYVPLTTSLLISLGVTLLLWLFSRR